MGRKLNIEPVDAHVGAKLRVLRRMRNVTQDSLAKAVGVTFQQIQKYETGSNRISASMLVKIARVLEWPASRFLDDAPGAPAMHYESDDWGEAQEFVVKVPGSLDVLRCFAAMSREQRTALLTVLHFSESAPSAKAA